MLYLASTDSIELITSAAGSIDYTASWATLNSAAFSAINSGAGNITTATTTTIVAAPTNQSTVKSLSFRNASTASNTLTLQKDVSGANRTIMQVTLSPGETWLYIESFGFLSFDASGRQKTVLQTPDGIGGLSVDFMKVGTAAEAVGVRYCFSKDTGLPGAWAVGSPGINGRATDGNNSSDAGCITFPDPASGSMYLTGLTANAGVTGQLSLIDLMWCNSGISVTTTTNQAITPASLPARDLNGSTNGEGVQMGLLVTTATTNAGAVTNCTATYTDSDGNASNTATMASFPATCAIGSLIPFQLAAGDRGVRSCQGVTLGTSLVTGAVSLVLYRELAKVSIPVINTGFDAKIDSNTGVRVYNDTCGLLVTVPSATTAHTIAGTAYFANR